MTPRVSPSQISNWQGCQRRWAYSYQAGRPRTPSSKAAEFGERTHLVLESWLLDGTPPNPKTPEGRVALPGLKHLPMPGTARVEGSFAFEYDNVLYNGRLDFAYQAGAVAVVGDHKTTGRPDAIKTADQLLDDPQRIIYSRWALDEFRSEYVIAQWIYYMTRGTPRAEPVVVLGTRAEVDERFERQHRDVVVPLVAAKGRPPEELPQNPAACYSGWTCPYIDECKPPISQLTHIRSAR